MASTAAVVSVVFLVAIVLVLLYFIFSALGGKRSGRKSAVIISTGESGGKAVEIVLFVIVILIAAVIVFVPLLYIWPYWPTGKDIMFCGDDWKKSVGISAGNWRVDKDFDGNCMLTGNGTLDLGNRIFGRIEIIPLKESPKDFEFKVGNFYTANVMVTWNPCRDVGMTSQPSQYYAPRFYYSYDSDWEHRTKNICTTYYETPQSIILSRSFWNFFDDRILQMVIGDNLMAVMLMGEGNHEPATGNVTFSSNQIGISEIKIFCDERCVWERIKPW